MSEIAIPEDPRPIDVSAALTSYESAILSKVAEFGLPTGGVLVDISQRISILSNVGSVIEPLPAAHRSGAVYMSKFMLAVSAGLFDAALNYLWDETIGELRKRIVAYDLNYFFDQAVTDPDKRKDLREPADLTKITDDELIRAAAKIGFISPVGQQQLDLVRYMRNHASAAHPNQHEIGPYQLLAFMETCIREVILLPESPTMVATGRLLYNVKNTTVTAEAAAELAGVFNGLRPDQVELLANGLFGIYTATDSSTVTRDNVRLLAPQLWPQVPESVRSNFGVRQARFKASLDQNQADLAREFLSAVDGLSYLSEDIRLGEIDTLIDELRRAHDGMDNFYNEPPVATRLAQIVGTQSIPLGVETKYVEALATIFLGRSSGVSWRADAIYENLLTEFTPDQAARALYLMTGPEVAAIVSYEKPRAKFKQALGILQPKHVRREAKALSEAVEAFTSTPDKLILDSKIQTLRRSLEQALAG